MALEQRVDSLAQEVGDLRAEVALLREKVGSDALPGEGGRGQLALGSDGGGIGATVVGDVEAACMPVEAKESSDDFEELRLQESVWDSAVLMFLPGVGWAGSLELLMVIVVNVILQVVFVIICAGEAFEASLPSPSDAMKWRITDGHRQEYMGTGGFVSLAARVCGGDDSLTFSNGQMDLVQTIDNYLAPMSGDRSGHILNSQGGALCFVVVFLWVNVVVRDVRSTIDYLSVIWHLPKSQRTILHNHESSAVLESVSITRRVCLLFTCFFRMGVAGLLGYYGSKWLCSTIQITELVLNAAALAFVLEIDEMLYKTLAPLSVSTVLGHLEPLKRPQPRNIKGLDLFSSISFIGCLLATIMVYHVHASDLYNLLQDVNHELCTKGDLNFVVQVNQDLGFPLMTWTNNYSSDSLTNAEIRASWFRNAVGDVINATDAHKDDRAQAQTILKERQSVVPLSETKNGREEGSKSQFLSYLNLGVENFGVLTCEDPAAHTPMLLRYLRDIYSKPNATSCEDFKEFCGQPDASNLRFSCARTCGCHTVTSGLFSLTGCAQICLEERELRISALPCQSADDSHPELEVAASTLAFNWETHPAVGQPNILSSALANGCASAVQELGVQERWRLDYLCNPLPGRASLAAICPYECGCSETNTLEGNCPLSCEGRSVSPTSCEVGLCPYGELKGNVTVDNGTTCANYDLYMFARIYTEPACIAEREALQSACCEVPPGPCSLCPRGTELLPGNSVPASSPVSPNANCASVEAGMRAQDSCRIPGFARPVEWLQACCGGSGLFAR